ncbi:hypothetical protein F4809DRAFT_639907 [Biscogniauxia mediterranea]|nr:hypothetical protein F4809DRAFT_639907 [Biscogniauxia mediterranea]
MLDAFEDDDSEGDDVSSCGEEPFDLGIFRATEAEQEEFEDLFSTHASSSTIAIHKYDASGDGPSKNSNSDNACSSSPAVCRPRSPFGASRAKYISKETDDRSVDHILEKSIDDGCSFQSIIPCSSSVRDQVGEDMNDNYNYIDKNDVAKEIIVEEYDALDDFLQDGDDEPRKPSAFKDYIDDDPLWTDNPKGWAAGSSEVERDYYHTQLRPPDIDGMDLSFSAFLKHLFAPTDKNSGVHDGENNGPSLPDLSVLNHKNVSHAGLKSDRHLDSDATISVASSAPVNEDDWIHMPSSPVSRKGNQGDKDRTRSIQNDRVPRLETEFLMTDTGDSDKRQPGPIAYSLPSLEASQLLRPSTRAFWRTASFCPPSLPVVYITISETWHLDQQNIFGPDAIV